MNIESKTRFRFAAVITLLNVAIATGFSVAGLVSPELIIPAGSTPSSASAVFAMYAAARTAPLALAVLLSVILGSEYGLMVLGSLAGAIQACDALVGLSSQDVGKTIGPLVLAILESVAIYILRPRRTAQASSYNQPRM